MTSGEEPLVSCSLCWGVGKRTFRKASLPGMRKGNFSAGFRQKRDSPAPGNPLTTIRGGSVWGRGELSRLVLISLRFRPGYQPYSLILATK
jgi:hypothetical protein